MFVVWRQSLIIFRALLFHFLGLNAWESYFTGNITYVSCILIIAMYAYCVFLLSKIIDAAALSPREFMFTVVGMFLL